MGRKKKPAEAYLMKSLEVFWRKGYEGTSINDLTENLGVGAQSIYNVFGDKEGLYLATIQYFVDKSEDGFALALRSKEDASLPEILLHFAVNRRLQLLDDSKQSCYVANCSIEMGGLNPHVQELSNVFFTQLKDAFKFAIENAQLKGEIDASKNADILGWYLVNAINSFGILKKSGVSIEKIDEVMSMTLSILDGYSDKLLALKIAEVEEMYPMLMEMMYADDWN